MDASKQAMADRLKLARENKGFDTATAAAEALRLPEQTYLAHENGSRGFRASATRYASFFGVNLEWLITGRGKMTGPGSPVLELFEALDPPRQREAMTFLEFLKERE
jgi:hypothetical protein